MSESKDIKALRVLRLQGVDLAFQRAHDNLISALQQLNVPDEDMQVLSDILSAFADPESVAQFKEMFAPAYTSRFTEEELDELVQTMSTPTYQKFVKAQPEIAVQNMEKSLKWAQSKIIPILKKIGIDLDLMDDSDLLGSFGGPLDQ